MANKKNIHNGDLVAKPGVVYECEEIGGYLDARGADTKTAFPKLTKTNDAGAVESCRRHLFQANLKIGYYYADGILARLVNRRGRVARVVVCGKTITSYVVDDGIGNYSHGATLEEARRGLLYKLSSRDTAPFKAWTRKTVVPLGDAIKAYRAITGACEAGTRHFCEQSSDLPDKLTIANAIERTNGKYGADVFAGFFAR